MEQTLGKRIVMHRKRLGLTQEQLAESLGVTSQAVSKWENDQSCPDISMLPKLAQLFGISVDSLLGNETQPVYEAEIVQPEKEKKNWEFHWNPGKHSQIGLAVLILAMGIQLILSIYLQRDLSFWELLWPTALFVIGAWGIISKFSFFRLGCVVFGGYFLLDKWELFTLNLGGNIVFPVILLLLGLSLLVDSIRKGKKPMISFEKEGGQNYSYTCDADMFELDASFGNLTQEITLSQLREGNIETCFGSYTVDLTQVGSVTTDCSLDADCSFGQLTLLVPKRFCLRNAPSTAFGNAEVIGQPDPQPEGYINLDANISFGKIIIEYT